MDLGKGKVQFKAWNELQKAENYKEGFGLYATVENDTVIGLIDVQGLDTDQGQAFIVHLPFPPSVVAENIKKSMSANLMEHIQQCCDKVCDTVKHYDEKACEQYNLIMEGMKGIHDRINEGGTGSGIGEKTLLDALRIVSQQAE